MRRYEILGALEDGMREYLGIDGHACMLRLLCETAQVRSYNLVFTFNALPPLH